MKFLLSMLLVLGFISCSGSKSAKKDGEIELSDASEFTEAEDDIVAEAMVDDSSMVSDGAPISMQEMSGDASGEYTVQANETLMMISFKIYGDYAKWRWLAKWNSEKLTSSFDLTEGMTLKYVEPAEKFVWSPEGSPYLIKSGDTLGTISESVYGSTQYWKEIWQNNKPLIKDPNKIFAGFTIYTPELDSRDVANI